MKIRRWTILLTRVIATMAFLLNLSDGFAVSKDKIIITVGSSYMYVNGVKKQLDPNKGISPQTIGSNIYTTVGNIVKEMGGSVVWTAKEKKLDIELGKTAIKMWVDKKYAFVNGRKTNISAAPKVVKGQPMVPVKVLIQQLGALMTIDRTNKKVTITYSRQKSESTMENWKYLVINDYEIGKDKVLIREKGGESYIFIHEEGFKYAFLYPYLTSPFPEFVRQSDTFTATWSDNGNPLLEIRMDIDSPTFLMNGKEVDAGMGPIKVGAECYIPINPFIAVLDMSISYEESANSIMVQYKKNFPKDILVGYWSDIDTDLFTEFKDPSTGAKSLASFANAYIYHADGTYQLRILAVGGFSDSFLEQTGRYKIMGNVIMHYNIRETLYKGTPFVLQYKNKLLDQPDYSFIDNYYPDEKRITIDLIPVTKRERQ